MEEEEEERKKRMTEKKDQEEEEEEKKRKDPARRFTRGAYIHRGRLGCCGGAHRESNTDSTDER